MRSTFIMQLGKEKEDTIKFCMTTANMGQIIFQLRYSKYIKTTIKELQEQTNRIDLPTRFPGTVTRRSIRRKQLHWFTRKNWLSGLRLRHGSEHFSGYSNRKVTRKSLNKIWEWTPAVLVRVWGWIRSAFVLWAGFQCPEVWVVPVWKISTKKKW